MREGTGSMLILKEVCVAITHHNVDLIHILDHVFVTHKVDFLGIGLLLQQLGIYIIISKVE